MRSRSRLFVVGCLSVMALSWLACGEKKPEVNELAIAEVAWLTENKTKLDALRQELSDLKAQATDPEAADDTEGDGGDAGEAVEGEGGASLEDQVVTKEAEVDMLADEFSQRIVNYFNVVDQMIEGVEPTENQLAVIRLKSSEDIVLASEYIDRGGDYNRAIGIYETAMALDPDNPDLQAALANAQEMRYMTEERLAQVKKGMSQDEVRALLGQVKLRNIREYPQEVIAWFYPTDDQGSASAVWFRKNRGGEHEVYKTDFEQVQGGAAPAA